MDWSLLSAPTPRDEIKYRPLAGRQVKYVDARFIMDRLDTVVGPEHWWFKWDVITIPKDGHPGCVRGYLTVKDVDQAIEVTKSDVGEYEISKMASMKAGVSDALKRCAVHFGIGRDLYHDEIISIEQEKNAPRPMKEIMDDIKEIFTKEKPEETIKNTENPPKATPNQMKFLQVLSDRFSFTIPTEISKMEASKLISQYSEKTNE